LKVQRKDFCRRRERVKDVCDILGPRLGMSGDCREATDGRKEAGLLSIPASNALLCFLCPGFNNGSYLLGAAH